MLATNEYLQAILGQYKNIPMHPPIEHRSFNVVIKRFIYNWCQIRCWQQIIDRFGASTMKVRVSLVYKSGQLVFVAFDNYENRGLSFQG